MSYPPVINRFRTLQHGLRPAAGYCLFRRLERRRPKRPRIPKIASDFDGAGPPATRQPQPPASEPASAFEPADAGVPAAPGRPPVATPALLLTAPPVAGAPALEGPPA